MATLIDPDAIKYLQSTFGFDEIGAYRALALSRADVGDLTGAREVLAAAAEKFPRDIAFRIIDATLLPVILPSTDAIRPIREAYFEKLIILDTEAATHTGERSRFNGITDPAREVNKSNFYLAYHGEDDCAYNQLLANVYRAWCPTLHYRAPRCEGYKGPEIGAKIRVGFCSANFTNHSVARWFRGTMAHLDRERFEVWGIKPAGPSDALTERMIAELEGRWLTASTPLVAARQQVTNLNLDVLIYTDIGMDPWTYFLAHSRLAPVQAVCFGHPVTTGIPTLDYFLSASRLEPDGGEHHYTEQLIQLPELPYYYQPERSGVLNPDVRAILDAERRAGHHLYLCPQSLFKIHPDCDRVWATILREDPDGVLFVIAGRAHDVTAALLGRMRSAHLDVASRIQVLPSVPSPEFPELLAAVDVLLDPLHWSGGITSIEAFTVGTPVVTMPGRFMRGRVTTALYRTMFIEHPIVETLDDYVARAVALGTNRLFRHAWSDLIKAQAHSLFEREEWGRALEGFLEKAVKDAVAK